MIWTSGLAGLGVTIAFSLAILGVGRAHRLRRATGRAAGGYWPSAVLGVPPAAVVAGALVFGIVVMTSK